MKRLITFSCFVLMCMWLSAQNPEHVFDMDKLIAKKGFLLSQNNPNPFNGCTDVYLAVADKAEVSLVIADVYGHLATTFTASLESGIHQFRITLKAKGNYVIGAHRNGSMSSAVMMCHAGGGADNIEYLGMAEAIDEDVFAQLVAEDKEEDFVAYSAVRSVQMAAPLTNEPFRVALSLSPFTLKQFEQGYTFKVGDKTATTPAELQTIYRDLGSTEMYVRLATKRHKTYNADNITLKDSTDGKPDENANVHTFDQVIQTCKIAAALNIPINPEVMCAYIYIM